MSARIQDSTYYMFYKKHNADFNGVNQEDVLETAIFPVQLLKAFLELEDIKCTWNTNNTKRVFFPTKIKELFGIHKYIHS